MNQDNASIVELAGGELQLWIEQEQSICLRAISREGDPVELSIDEARSLIGVLTQFVAEIDK